MRRPLILATFLLAAPASAGVLFKADFQAHKPGPYTASEFRADWGMDPPDSAGVEAGRVTIVEDPLKPGHHVLRVTYMGKQIGGNSAMTFTLPIEKGHATVWFQYSVMFDKDFVWVRGGKLPGLAGGDFPTGCVKDGSYDGFSTRVMWREKGLAWSYLYYPGKHSDCGDDYVLPVRFQRGRWYTLTQEVTLNDLGKANGSLRQYIDGRLVGGQDGWTWRRAARSGIDGVKMDTFFGGGEPDWAPPLDQYAYFDAFVVSTERPSEIALPPLESEWTQALREGWALWAPDKSYQAGDHVAVRERDSPWRYVIARKATKVRPDADTTVLDIYEGVHWPADLDTGQPWLEVTGQAE